MCIQHVAAAVPECPAFPDVFLRDLPARMDLGPKIRRQLVRVKDFNVTYDTPLARSMLKEWSAVQKWAMAPFQPCRSLSIQACYLHFVEALK